MIQIIPQMRLLLCVEPVDFRKGIDGLSRVCRVELQKDPFSGAAFVFRNRRATAIKILIYDGQGYWLCQKRLSRGHFHWWPGRTDGRVKALAAHELQLLIWNGNPDRGRVAPAWRSVDLPQE